MTQRAYIALGSNLGERRAMLEAAVERLGQLPGTQVVARAGVLETQAVLPPEDDTPQPAYLNTVVAVDTWLSPRELMAALRQVEEGLGRKRSTRWAPRTIDLDLLLVGALVLDEPGLTVPHPQLHHRRFVLEPLCELAPGLVHPVLGQTVEALLGALTSATIPR